MTPHIQPSMVASNGLSFKVTYNMIAHSMGHNPMNMQGLMKDQNINHLITVS